MNQLQTVLAEVESFLTAAGANAPKFIAALQSLIMALSAFLPSQPKARALSSDEQNHPLAAGIGGGGIIAALEALLNSPILGPIIAALLAKLLGGNTPTPTPAT